MFVLNEKSSFWRAFKGVLETFLNTGKEKSLIMTRCKIFETLLQLCEEGELPVDSKHYIKNMLFKKALLRNFFDSKKEKYRYVDQWEKLRSTTYYEVI